MKRFMVSKKFIYTIAVIGFLAIGAHEFLQNGKTLAGFSKRYSAFGGAVVLPQEQFWPEATIETEEAEPAKQVSEKPSGNHLAQSNTQTETGVILEKPEDLQINPASPIAPVKSPEIKSVPKGSEPQITMPQKQPEQILPQTVTSNNPPLSENTENLETSQPPQINAISYPVILISEIYVGSSDNPKEEFVELKNPLNQPVDLTGWYLQRRTKTGSSYNTFAPAGLFSGKTIIANGYFLIARKDSSFAGKADIILDNPLTSDNALALKNPDGEISDKVGWGQAPDYESAAALSAQEGASIGRKIVAGQLQDTGANNNDFELQTPTPKSDNIAYVASVQEEIPSVNDTTVLKITATVSANKVLINEIQIDGIEGTGGTEDDWVQLYNPNDAAVNLNGWSIQKHSSKPECPADAIATSFYKKNFENGASIPAKGFFLIADTKAKESIRNAANMTAGWSLSDNATVYLVSSQEAISGADDANIVDKVGFGPSACFTEMRPAPSPPESKSIERKQLGLDTNDNSADFIISNEPTPTH